MQRVQRLPCRIFDLSAGKLLHQPRHVLAKLLKLCADMRVEGSFGLLHHAQHLRLEVQMDLFETDGAVAFLVLQRHRGLLQLHGQVFDLHVHRLQQRLGLRRDVLHVRGQQVRRNRLRQARCDLLGFRPILILRNEVGNHGCGLRQRADERHHALGGLDALGGEARPDRHGHAVFAHRRVENLLHLAGLRVRLLVVCLLRVRVEYDLFLAAIFTKDRHHPLGVDHLGNQVDENVALVLQAAAQVVHVVKAAHVARLAKLSQGATALVRHALLLGAVEPDARGGHHVLRGALLQALPPGGRHRRGLALRRRQWLAIQGPRLVFEIGKRLRVGGQPLVLMALELALGAHERGFRRQGNRLHLHRRRIVV